MKGSGRYALAARFLYKGRWTAGATTSGASFTCGASPFPGGMVAVALRGTSSGNAVRTGAPPPETAPTRESDLREVALTAAAGCGVDRLTTACGMDTRITACGAGVRAAIARFAGAELTGGGPMMTECVSALPITRCARGTLPRRCGVDARTGGRTGFTTRIRFGVTGAATSVVTCGAVRGTRVSGATRCGGATAMPGTAVPGSGNVAGTPATLDGGPGSSASMSFGAANISPPKTAHKPIIAVTKVRGPM